MLTAEYAVRYASQGWFVLPCREKGEHTKAPYTEHGEKDATTDRSTIKEWWDRTPHAMMGIATGPSGLCVIDCDRHHESVDGVKNFEKLCKKNGGVLKTLTVGTPSGGRHYYFKRNRELKSLNGLIPGVDVRASSGYVIAPPSRLENGGEYVFECEEAIAELPEWLEKALMRPDWTDSRKGQKRPFSGTETPYARAVFEIEIEALRTAPVGCRNDTLNRAAFILGGWVSGGELSEQAVLDAMERAACDCGLTQSETIKTMNSGFKAGLEHPRNTPEASPAMPEDDAPIPLRRPPAEQKEYPVWCFGDFQDALVDVANGINVSVSMAGNSMLGVLDLLTQAIANVKTRRFSATPLSLYLMSVAESGDGKSETESIFMKPVEQHEKEKQQEYLAAFREYQAENAAYERELEKLKKQKLSREEYAKALHDLMESKPKQPVQPLFVVGDTNIEGLYRFLAEGKPHVGLFTDEGARLFGGTAFSQENAQKTVGALTAVWSGKPLDKMRYGDGATKLHNRRVCSNIMMQPVIAERLFSDALLSGQGYMYRNLITWPMPMMKSSSQVSVESLPSVQSFYRACERLLAVPLKKDADGGIIFDEITLNDDAHKEYDRFFDAIEQNRIDGEYSPVNGYAKRAAEQALRLAGVLTLAHEPACRVISGEFMQSGMELANWYLDEVLRITLDDMASPEVLRAEKLLNWYRGRGIETTSIRQVIQYGPGSLREKKDVQAAINTLEEHNFLVPIPGGAEVWEGGDKKRKVRKAWKVRLA